VCSQFLPHALCTLRTDVFGTAPRHVMPLRQRTDPSEPAARASARCMQRDAEVIRRHGRTSDRDSELRGHNDVPHLWCINPWLTSHMIGAAHSHASTLLSRNESMRSWQHSVIDQPWQPGKRSCSLRTAMTMQASSSMKLTESKNFRAKHYQYPSMARRV
jgi:hypothetical protein